jgi:hypothetical protein
VADGAAAVVLLVTAGLRGRLLVYAVRDDVDGDPGTAAAPSDPDGDEDDATSNDRPAAGTAGHAPSRGTPE